MWVGNSILEILKMMGEIKSIDKKGGFVHKMNTHSSSSEEAL
jgi:hypothetical protein